MSYDLRLMDPDTKETIELDHPHQLRGGTFCVGGTPELVYNITYNYSAILKESLGSCDGIRSIYGMTGEKSIPILEQAIGNLKDDIGDDYWQPTEGNVKLALKALVALAKMAPWGVWDGD